MNIQYQERKNFSPWRAIYVFRYLTNNLNLRFSSVSGICKTWKMSYKLSKHAPAPAGNWSSIKIKGWKLRNDICFFKLIFIHHFEHKWTGVAPSSLKNKASKRFSNDFDSKIFQHLLRYGEQGALTADIGTPTTTREKIVKIYLW